MKFWSRLVRLLYRSESNPNIPNEFHEQERLIRGIYSPINVKTNALNIKVLQPSAFKSPPEKDEISVLRLEYTDGNFCKQFIKNGQSLEREYIGLAVINYNEVISTRAYAVYSPLEIAIMHADIKTGYPYQRGVAAPAELNIIVKELTKLARFKEDPNPQIDVWNGEELK